MLVKTINNKNTTYLTKLIKSKSFNNKGFTLVEIIVVIAIISILALIVVPSYIGYKEKAERQVCNTNILQFQKDYNVYLIIEDVDHTESIFDKSLRVYDKIICPGNGNVSYENCDIQCSIHHEAKGDDKENDSVPYS